jgi:CheY-like chemotaxis protein
MPPFTGVRVFIVEDEALIALSLADLLESLGCGVVGMAFNKADALRMIETSQTQIDVATLDVNLGAETSHEVAVLLSKLQIPFVVATGYDDAVHLAGLTRYPIVNKPFEIDSVERGLRSLGFPRS